MRIFGHPEEREEEEEGEREALKYAITDDGEERRNGRWRWALTEISSTFMIVISSKLRSNLFGLAGEVH